MKKRLTILAMSALLFSCGGYDDSAIREELDSQDARIESLAREIAELRGILDAVKAGDCVTGVEELSSEGVTTGIKVLFRNSPEVTIMFSFSGSAGSVMNAEVKDGSLIFTLGSGETLSIPVFSAPVLSLERDSVLLFPGKTATVAYAISGGDSDNSVSLFVEGLWEAGVSEDAISLTAPSPCTPAKIVVVATSGAGLSSFATIVCSEARLTATKASWQVNSDSGTLEVPVSTNLASFEVEVEEGALWLRKEAVTAEGVTLVYDANEGDARSATVTLRDDESLAEFAFTVSQEEGGTFIWKPVSKADSVTEGVCIVSFLRKDGSKQYFLPGATSLPRNPALVEAAGAGVTFDGTDITAVNPDYTWKIAASGDYWTLEGKGGLYLIACDKFQGVAVLSDLKGYYQSTNTYTRSWSFTDDAEYGMQMKVPESAGRQLMIGDTGTAWNMTPTAERNGGIILYYKTRQ